MSRGTVNEVDFRFKKEGVNGPGYQYKNYCKDLEWLRLKIDRATEYSEIKYPELIKQGFRVWNIIFNFNKLESDGKPKAFAVMQRKINDEFEYHQVEILREVLYCDDVEKCIEDCEDKQGRLERAKLREEKKQVAEKTKSNHETLDEIIEISAKLNSILSTLPKSLQDEFRKKTGTN